ncbi:hypothetical protein AKJ16_DCAP02371 [Drosera capensis]
MRVQKLVDWVKHAQLSVCRNNKWLYHCMSVQPASSRKIIKSVDFTDSSLLLALGGMSSKQRLVLFRIGVFG